MYLLYEHHKDSDGNILATDMLLTSVFPGKPFVSFKNAAEKAIFELCKLTFKEIHTKERTIDMDTYIWSFFGDAGRRVYEKLKASPLATVGLKFERVENLASQKASGYIDALKASGMDPADFFYQQAAPASSGPTIEQVEKKLAALLDIDTPDLETCAPGDLKKLYRQAAMRLHPDRNNGDAKGMTELNYYWQEWQKMSPGVKI